MTINLDHVTEQITVTDTATNASLTVQPKGAGAFNVAAGSGGLINLSNGGTVTAITKTADGTLYTTLPTISVSAPTTAGGVQATLQLQMYFTPTTIVSGGTGYTVGDVLTLVGGTPVTTASSITVTAVSGGVITGAARTNFNSYTVLPTNPVSVTGGTGSGATFNLTWAVGAIVITNAGSGYVEQPTVSFSGGGGSGAAAYATVGSGTTVRGLGSTISFSTPNGEGFRIADGGTTSSAYWTAYGTSTTPSLRAVSSISGSIETASAVPIQFKTNIIEQFRVSHTASAVNYVQVTGAATGNIPTISAQGSDTNINFSHTTKGSGYHLFYSDNGASPQFSIARAASTVNYVEVIGAATGGRPTISSQGSDTNIDLAFTPKGTGNVRFGTYTANMALTIQGYVEIKDSGGTVRRLAVIA